MTPTEELTDAEIPLESGGRIPDEDLEAVTGGLTRPLEPQGRNGHGIGSRSDAGHDDTSDA